MAELSFGHNLRAKRKEVVTNTLSFLPWAQGCLTACGPTGGKGLEGPAEGSVKFKGAPNKMLGITLHEYGSAQMLKVQMVNLPAELQDNELLIKVKAAGVNPMDCKLRSGSLQQLYPLTLPVILGCEWSGTVVKAGRCAKYKPGDQVFGRQTLDRLRHTSGAYAQYMVADSAECCSKPSALSHIQAASVPWAGLTAYGAVVRAGGLREEVAGEGAGGLLVLGASGGVGSYAVQLARHALGSKLVVGTSSAPNAPFLHALGAHTVVSYTDAACWSLLSTAAQQAPGGGFAVVLDCVGGDDYWEHGQGLLRGGGVYVTLVGGKRYGAEADNKGVISVAGAVSDQVRTSVRAGLGLLGAQHKYTLFTPSMTNSADLKVLAALLQKRTIIPVVKQVVSMYEAADAHRVLDAHHAVGKTVLQVGKKGEDDEDTSEEGSAEEEEEEEEGAAGSEPDEDDDMAGLKAQQEAVAARIKASLASHTPPHAPPRSPAGLLDIDPDLDPEDVAWVETSGAAQLMRHLHRQRQPKPAGAPRKEAAGGGGKKGREEGGGAEGGGGGGGAHTHTPSSHTHTADPPKSVSFAGLEGEGELGGRISKKEQYRLAMLKEKAALEAEGGGGGGAEEEEDDDDDVEEAGGGGAGGEGGGLADGRRLHVQASVTHAGTLRRKKEAHRRFEDPYKTVCKATLELGVLRLERVAGERVGEAESFDLGQGWTLQSRHDRTDRFTLTRQGPILDSSQPSQVTLKAGSKAEGAAWISKLRDTALWFASRERRANGLRAGQPPTLTSPSPSPADHSPFLPKNPPLPPDPAPKCGVGMVLKQCDGFLEVKRLAEGGAAERSGKIAIGDILLKVNGRSVITASGAAEVIVGAEGSQVELALQRPGLGRQKPTLFSLALTRAKPKPK